MRKFRVWASFSSVSPFLGDHFDGGPVTMVRRSGTLNRKEKSPRDYLSPRALSLWARTSALFGLEREFDQHFVLDQVVGHPGVDDFEILAVDAEVGCDVHLVGIRLDLRGEGD